MGSLSPAPARLAPAAPADSTQWAIEVSGITRQWGASRVLRGLDLRVPWDQRVAVLGGNGAGKTTLLRILATLTRPTAGQVRIGGLALPEQATAVRRHLGLVAHQTFLYDELTVHENLVFYGRLYGLSDPTPAIAAVLEQVGLTHRAGDRVRTLSRGLQQRAALARAVLHDPPILLLDEPDTGLDLGGAEILPRLLVDRQGRPRTVLLTTHHLERAWVLADRLVILANGKVAHDRPREQATVEWLVEAVRDASRLGARTGSRAGGLA
jgi:heme exporter protein A